MGVQNISESMEMPSMSVIIPAFNEENYLPQTLDHLKTAIQQFRTVSDADVQIIVVDNTSTDRTAELSRSAGATVIREEERNIARVRNAGAAIAEHEVLVFLDADTLVPSELLIRIAQTMADPMIVGGAVDCLHQSSRLIVRIHLKLWRIIGLIFGMAQGACQFCRSDIFRELGEYDETLYMGEDVYFYLRLKRLARRRGFRISMIGDIRIIPSARKLDRWPLWRILLWTNPVFAFAFKRQRWAWSGWYKKPLR